MFLSGPFLRFLGRGRAAAVRSSGEQERRGHATCLRCGFDWKRAENLRTPVLNQTW